MQAYSKEFRRDVLAACDAGVGMKEVSLQFGVSESWVRRIKQQRRETGQIAPKTTRKRRPRWERGLVGSGRKSQPHPTRTFVN